MTEGAPQAHRRLGADDIYLLALLRRWASSWKLISSGVLIAGSLGFGAASLMEPIYTARAVLLPPQQSSGAALLGSLGALVGAGAGGPKSPAEQYVSFMLSNRVLDPIIDRYELMKVYGVELRHDARRLLSGNSQILLGKRDGLISIAVDDTSPQRAADIANAYIEGLRTVTTTLSVTEGQQRRVFFEQQLQQVKERLIAAQAALQSSGYSTEVLKAEPRAAAEAFARAKAEYTAADIRLQSLRRMLSAEAPEVLQQSAVVSALKVELDRLQKRGAAKEDVGYIGKYREFKHQEALFEMFSKQYEQARLDESRDGTLIQVLDAAVPPERKSKPKRSIYAAVAGLLAFVALSGWTTLRHTRAPRAGPPA